MFVDPDDIALTKNDSLQKAAVLIPILVQENELHVILTKRSETVQHHKGQICFPGGAVDDSDTSLWHTALRETHEEIGIESKLIYFIDELKRIVTPTLFEITPYIGFVTCLPELNPNPHEIDEIITVPLRHFLDRNNLRFEEREYFGKSFTVPFFAYQHHEIWGATGKIILNFLERWK